MVTTPWTRSRSGVHGRGQQVRRGCGEVGVQGPHIERAVYCFSYDDEKTLQEIQGAMYAVNQRAC